MLAGNGGEVQYFTDSGEAHLDDSHGEADAHDPACQQLDLTDDLEGRDDFGSVSGNYTYRHHVQRRVKLFMPKGGSFPF